MNYPELNHENEGNNQNFSRTASGVSTALFAERIREVCAASDTGTAALQAAENSIVAIRPNQSSNVLPHAEPEAIQSYAARKEAEKIESMYKDTLTNDDHLRQEAFAAMKSEGQMICQNPGYKSAVIENLHKHLGNLLIVEADADGQPQALRFTSLKQLQDQQSLKIASERNDQVAVEAAHSALIMDGIGGGIIVPVLSAGQTKVDWVR